MKKITQLVFVLLILTTFSCRNNSLNGKVLIGFEEDKYMDAGSEYFETILKFKNDSVLVERNLISKAEKNKHYKKLGIQYRYKGLVKKDKSNLKFVAIQYKCNDCPPIAEVGNNGEIKDVLDQKEYQGYCTENGVHLNGINFNQH